MSTALPFAPGAEIDYPTTDGEPMGETPLHRRIMNDAIETLDAWFKDDPQVFVAGNMMLYYVEGNPRKQTSPDVMVVPGIAKEQRRDVFLVWKEGKAPACVIEITSATTADNDLEGKFRLYQDVLRVKEYFLFDPRSEYLDPPLQGYRLIDGKYEPIELQDGRLPSEVLGLHLERDGEWLRFYDPVKQVWLRSQQEIREALYYAELAQAEARLAQARLESSRQQEAQARAEAEAARQQEAQARARAEKARQQEAQARAQAEAARQQEAQARAQAEAARQQEAQARAQAEDEVQQLRRELEALRQQLPKQT